MTKVAAAALQTLWDCRWSRPAQRLGRAQARDGQEASWVCIRAGWRPVTEEECERCPDWEGAESIGERDERG